MTRRDNPVTALIVTTLLLLASLGLVFSYRQQVVNLKGDIYTQCQARERYDMSSQDTRAAFRRYYTDMITTESHNRFIDDSLRAQRVAGARELISALDDTLAKTVPGGCVRYKP